MIRGKVANYSCAMADEEGHEPERVSPTVLVQNIESFSTGDSRTFDNFYQAIDHAAEIGGWTDLQRIAVPQRVRGLSCSQTNNHTNKQRF